jgi:peptidoglycan/LPS O-acetylase OafA/YrhL
MMYHFTVFGELPESILPVTYFGWMGVDLFFVLSGFLIGQQLFRGYLPAHPAGRQLSIVQFYQRRAWRILPTYCAVLALYVCVPAWREYPVLAPLWKFLTFTMNFGFSFQQRAFSHAWSLCVEEHFYLLLPLLTAWFMRKPGLRNTVAAILCIALSGILLRAWLITHFPDDVWPRIYYPTYTRLDGLLVGVTLALVSTFRPAWWKQWMQRGHTLFLCGVACLAPVFWMLRDHNLGDNTGSAKWAIIVGFPLLSIGLGFITASSVSVNGLLARLKIPGAQTLATLAFTLYLTHKAVAHLLMVHLPQITAAQGPLSWLLYATGCLAAAFLLHICVERPFLRLRDRKRQRKSAPQLEKEMRTDPAL